MTIGEWVTAIAGTLALLTWGRILIHLGRKP
jgi:hypothetical protein